MLGQLRLMRLIMANTCQKFKLQNLIFIEL